MPVNVFLSCSVGRKNYEVPEEEASRHVYP
uniref:Uncharacterized protein n=1 Tax=Rhizophora mucronata TaxID=61149 RepID=A0A2P2P3K0_RHIMU